ncbi:VOC family protein [Nakamurella alba]|uniref:VOC family protein n=1 Tax=Nakamurella alba TaxID=2665158 RepID=UPI0012B96AAA|nr:VOC family protein [Nakamurella alba]
MIKAIRGINIKVRDQDKAKAFWTEQVGLEAISDTPMPDFLPKRWLETRGVDGGAMMVLNWPIFDEVEFFSGITFICDDVLATVEELTAKGVEIVTAPIKAGFGWWATFKDLDGNVFVLREG